MKSFEFAQRTPIYMEFGQSSLKALQGDAMLDVPLDRLENGRLTQPCRERLERALKDFVQRKRWQPPVRAYCAIGARGVSLRRLTLPSTSKEETRRLLLLQIEGEFPLPPDELAWGCLELDGPAQLPAASATKEVLVVAAKKEVIGEYSGILRACGMEPVFTLAALARSRLCPQPSGPCAMLDLGVHHSEFLVCQDGTPSSVCVLSWGSEKITRSLEENLGIGREEAERLQRDLDHERTTDDEGRRTARAAAGAALDSLAAAIHGRQIGRRIFLTGKAAGQEEIASELGRRLDGMRCQWMGPALGEGGSAAIAGLKQSVEHGGGFAPLIIQDQSAGGRAVFAREGVIKWLRLAALLVLIALGLPYLEATLFQPLLSRKLAAVEADKEGRLAMINSEFRFLQHLKKSQPPYLDALYLLANAAPRGSRFDSVTMNRRGEVSLRGSMGGGQQVGEFRSKLLDSGFFSTVVVDEQTPTPNRQKVNVRITAHWKSTESRSSAKVDPSSGDGEPSSPAPIESPPVSPSAAVAPAGALPPDAAPARSNPSNAPPKPKE